jgi:hypothetical protein
MDAMARIIEIEARLARAERALEASHERLRRVERARAARTWATGGGALAAVAALFVLAGWRDLPASDRGQASQPTTVRAPFVVVDRNNTPIISVQESEIGTNSYRGIQIYNQSGAQVLDISGLPGVAGVFAYPSTGKQDGNAKAGFMVDSEGNGVLGIMDSRHEPLAEVRASGVVLGPALTLFDRGGAPVLRADASAGKGVEVFGSLSVADRGERLLRVANGAPVGPGVVITGGGEDTRRGMYLMNAAGNRLAVIGEETGRGHGVIVLGNGEGAPVVGMQAGTGGNSRGFIVLGPEGRLAAAMLGGTESADRGFYVYGEEKSIGAMTIRNGRGYFELADDAGSVMVEAGSLDSRRGYVIVNPYIQQRNNPSVLMGGRQ